MPDPPRDPREPMLDLPLGGSDERVRPAREEAPRERPSQDEPRRDGPAAPPPAARGEARRRGGLGRGLVLLLLLALAVAAGWLLRPDPAVLRVVPTAVEFGEVRVGAAAGSTRISIENRGGRRARIGAVTLDGASDPDFVLDAAGCAGMTLEAEAACDVVVGFEPKREGERRGRLSLDADASNGPWTVTLEGRGTAPRLEADQALLDFGPSPLGSRAPAAAVTLSNRGSAALVLRDLALEGAAAADFERRGDRCTGVTLEPGRACSLQIVFTPSADGRRQAVLRVRGDLPGPPLLVELTGVGLSAEAVADLGSEAIDFGEVVVGTGSAPRRVRVTNRGEAPMAVARVAVVDATQGFTVVDQDCTREPVAPAAACGVEVAFRPSGPGVAVTVLEVEGATRGGGLRIPLAGLGVVPKLELAREALQFGAVRLGRSEARAVEVRNGGTGTLRLGAAEIVGDTGFRVTPAECPPLAAGERCNLTVTFAPTSASSFRGELRLRPAAGGEARRVSLAGSGAEPRLEIESDSVDLGTVERPQSAAGRVRLASTGSAPVRLGAVTIVGSGAGDFRVDAAGCGERLDPGARCDLSLVFQPTADGLRTAVLSIAHDGGPSPSEVRLVGRAQPPAVPRAEVRPQSLDLGQVRVGERSEIRTVTLVNAGTGPLRFSSPILEGSDADPFYVVPGSCEGAPFLAPGAQCTVGVRFVPVEPGAVRARLVVRHEAAGGRVSVELTGVGLAIVESRPPAPPPGR